MLIITFLYIYKWEKFIICLKVYVQINNVFLSNEKLILKIQSGLFPYEAIFVVSCLINFLNESLPNRFQLTSQLTSCVILRTHSSTQSKFFKRLSQLDDSLLLQLYRNGFYRKENRIFVPKVQEKEIHL